MARFNPRRGARPRATGPAAVTGETTVTHEGASAYVRTAQTDLVFLALTDMVGQNTFYETAEVRDDRFRTLVRTVAAADPGWTGKFIGWLRNDAHMRTASLVAAAETAHVMLENGVTGARKIVDSALLRADEPGEFLGYWHRTYGRRLPMPVKRGVGDAALRLYNERSALKWDTSSHAIRFGDVLELTHAPDTRGAAQHLRFPAQGDLFRHLIDRRHGRGDGIPVRLETLIRNAALRVDAKTHPEFLLDAERLARAGMTWEDSKSLGGQYGLSSREIWEAMIPSMGYMALLRNLRNFDQAGVSEPMAAMVAQKLMTPSEVERSRQLPFRFLSAYTEMESLRWGHALETAVNLSAQNVPVVRGKSLVLVDVSGSMDVPVSAQSKITRRDVGALFGAILALRGEDATLVAFGTTHEVLGPPRPGTSALRIVDKMRTMGSRVGWGTYIAQALRGSYSGHDQVFVFTDEQAWGGHRYYGGYGSEVTGSVPADVPLFSFNLGGYAPSMLDLSRPNRFAIGGFSDKLFTLVGILLEGRDAKWPWE